MRREDDNTAGILMMGIGLLLSIIIVVSFGVYGVLTQPVPVPEIGEPVTPPSVELLPHVAPLTPDNAPTLEPQVGEYRDIPDDPTVVDEEYGDATPREAWIIYSDNAFGGVDTILCDPYNNVYPQECWE